MLTILVTEKEIKKYNPVSCLSAHSEEWAESNPRKQVHKLQQKTRKLSKVVSKKF